MDGKLYKIRSATRITLSPEAREICKLHGMSERDMARHLLNQHHLAEGGSVDSYDEDEPPEYVEWRRRDYYLPHSAASVHIEDRREEGYETPDTAAQFRELEPTPEEVFEFRGRDVPTSLGRELGYESVGQSRSQPHAFRASNPLPPDYLKDPVGYLLRASEFARLNPNYFERRGGAQ